MYVFVFTSFDFQNSLGEMGIIPNVPYMETETEKLVIVVTTT